MWNLTLTAGLCLVFASWASSQILMCGFNSMADERAEDGKFRISDIDPNLCTHLVYASADIKDNKIAPANVDDVQKYIEFNSLKESNPKLKTLLAVGGMTFSNQKFSSMAQTQENRAEFADSVVKLLRTMKFDGLNLDWRYPGGAGSQPEDKQRFTELCKELKNAFEADGTARKVDSLILSASVSAERAIIDASYEVDKIAGHLDFINVLTFDFHGPWENVIRHHSPLYTGSQDTGDNIYSNADSAMSYWRDQGAPADILTMGIAAYGRAFMLASDSTVVGAPAKGPAEEGCYTGEEGFWASYELCIYLEGVTTQRISDQKVPFATTESQWVGFDDTASLQAKATYLSDSKFAGAFVWSLDLDDFKGEFCNQGKNPFIKQLHDLLVPGFPQSNIPEKAPVPGTTSPTTQKPQITPTPSTTTTSPTTTLPTTSTPSTTTTSPTTTLPTTSTSSTTTTSPTTPPTTTNVPTTSTSSTTTTSPTTPPTTTNVPTTSTSSTTTTSPTTTPPTTTTVPTTSTTTTSPTTAPPTTTPTPTSPTTTTTTTLPNTTPSTTPSTPPPATSPASSTPETSPSTAASTTAQSASGGSCDGQTRYYRDPADPHFYFHCVHNIAHRMECAANLVFNMSCLCCTHSI